MKRNSILILALTLLFAIPMMAENGMNSPYTRYGFGQLASMETGTNKGMGGTGIGVQGSNQINMLNPASYAAIDTLTFLLDVGMSLQNANFSENGVKMNARNTTFDYLAMQFRLMPHLGFTLGMMPFSNIGYNFSNTISKNEDGTQTATLLYNGTGGLRQVTAGIGYAPIKGLSIGANLAYVYGEIAHNIHTQFSDPDATSMSKAYVADITTYKAELGLQYRATMGKNSLTIGATYQPGHIINDEAYVVHRMTTNDTISRSHLSIPTKYGVGFSFNHDKRLTIAADYSVEQYGAADFFGTRGADRHRASVGFEYIPELINRNLLRRARYRGGLHYATSYYTINGQQGPTEYGATLGIGLPIMNAWNGKSIINISGQAIHMRPNTPGLITENYLRLHIGISVNETWFNKWKVQ